jgi:hypothetical protein
MIAGVPPKTSTAERTPERVMTVVLLGGIGARTSPILHPPATLRVVVRAPSRVSAGQGPARATLVT